MNKKNFLFPTLIGCAGLALAFKTLSNSGQAKQSPKRTPTGATFDEIDAYLEEQVARLNIPGAALSIVDGEQLVHHRGFGRAWPGGEPPSPQTPFFIGSLTKSFTALAVMQLMEAGKIELDAPVQRYLPWFQVANPQASAQMTVRHLLNQTSGLSTWSGWTPLVSFDKHPNATEHLVRALARFKPARLPGEGYEYSNANYDVLGLIVETISGESYEEYMQRHIFDPLEMYHSYTKQARAQRDGLAAGHRFWFWYPFAAPNIEPPRGSLPSGQLIASAEDMAHYLIAQLNGGCYSSAQVLSTAGVAEMHRPAAAVEMLGWTSHYTMGWYHEEHDRMRILWHTGFVPDFAAYMALLPEQKIGAILLFNADHFMMNPVMTEVGHGLMTRVAGRPPLPALLGLSFVKVVPWATRALLLIPLLQIIGAAVTLRKLRRWREDPQQRPSHSRLWLQYILLPLIPNLALAAVPVILQVRKMLGFLLLFFPDFSWVALLGGGFAGVWSLLRTGLILRNGRKAN